ncbi:TetR/AcrR family transcriptional regulator [Microbacterium sp.]|uniref:TetR/AcrR family transcriptional regulator n=1 Tax=Microbacterium sp. TaxID=51671 RepID=UPI003A8FF237
MTSDAAGAPLWRGSARSSRDDARRRRLLDAALEVYGTTGFRGATVRSVCQEAHVSTRSFYELYSDQVALLSELYRELNGEVLAGFAGIAVDPHAPLRGIVRGLVGGALDPILADERKARVLEVESVGVSDALEQERRTAYRAFAEAIDQAFAALERAGRIEDAPGGLTSLVLVGGITEVLVQRMQTPRAGRADAADLVDDVTDVILRVVRGRPA